MTINDKKIESDEEIFNIIKGNFNSISFKVKKPYGDLKDINYTKPPGKKRLGIVIVPREVPKDTTIINVQDETFKDVMDKMKDKDKE